LAKELICVPDWNPNTLKYMTWVIVRKVYRNRIKTRREDDKRKWKITFIEEPIESHSCPDMPSLPSYSQNKEYVKEMLCFLTQFICPQYGWKRRTNKDEDDWFIRYDPLEYLNKLVKNKSSESWRRFITEEKVVYIPKSIKSKLDKKGEGLLRYEFEIHYKLVREEIVSFIEQKFGRNAETEKLKELFICDKQLSFQEYLDKKSKMLCNLDLSNCISDMNIKTDKKRIKMLEEDWSR